MGKRIWNILLMLVVFLILVCPVSAAIITVQVEGVVDLVNTQGGFALDGSVSLGSAITGFCTYDTDTADQVPSEYSGRYSLISISMSIGNYTFTHDPMSSISAFFEVSTVGNSYKAYSYTPRFDGTVYLDGIPKTFEDFSWTTFGLKLMYLATTLHEYFPTDALPDVDSFPDLSIFDRNKFIGVGTDEAGPGFVMDGRITSLTVIPEPATLFLLGLGGLVLLRRPRSSK